jgi:hypothetical protein
MNTLFAQEVYIRLADDNASFVCTVKYGKLYAKATEFALHCQSTPDVLDEKVLVFARKRSSRRAAPDER